MLTFPEMVYTRVIPRQSFEDYCKAPGINQTLLKKFGSPNEFGDPEDGCPRLYRHHVLNPETPDTEAMRVGRLFHAFLLEPRQFKETTIILDDQTRADLWADAVTIARENKSTAKYAKFETYAKWLEDTRASDPEANQPRGFMSIDTVKKWFLAQEKLGLQVVTDQEVAKFEAMRNEIRTTEDVWRELKDGRRDECELTALACVEFRDGKKLQLKARLDFVSGDGSIIDLKTARTSNPREFANQAARLGYDFQAAFYVAVAKRAKLKADRFGFLAIEKEPPYLPVIHWMPGEWLEYATKKVEATLTNLKHAIEADDWPGYSTGALLPPAWLEAQWERMHK